MDDVRIIEYQMRTRIRDLRNRYCTVLADKQSQGPYDESHPEIAGLLGAINCLTEVEVQLSCTIGDFRAGRLGGV